MGSHILVIEDSAPIRRLVEICLRDLGRSVASAGDGPSGLKAALDDPPGLIILDEASMAPIPALWVAASLADANAIVVGDFKQLPPIVLSEHKLAQKWLGRDVFDEAKLSPLPDPPP